VRNIENIEIISNIACLVVILCGKFATVSHGIWQTGLQNLEKFATENCGP